MYYYNYKQTLKNLLKEKFSLDQKYRKWVYPVVNTIQQNSNWCSQNPAVVCVPKE